MRCSSPSTLISVPEYLPKRILSPGFTVNGAFWPLSRVLLNISTPVQVVLRGAARYRTDGPELLSNQSRLNIAEDTNPEGEIEGACEGEGDGLVVDGCKDGAGTAVGEFPGAVENGGEAQGAAGFSVLFGEPHVESWHI